MSMSDFERNGNIAFACFAFAFLLFAVTHWINARHSLLQKMCADGSVKACAKIEELVAR